MGELQTQVRLLTAKCEELEKKLKSKVKCQCTDCSKKVSKTKTKKPKSVKSEKVETGEDPLK